ncbi:hypothetical protein [Lysinibacillus antri]|uniref:Uncharacterized protein n=1 Tax=Lysinibacillus antri TaxID=2498145 RepID=A0A3S0RXR3_9BACI|nr:hypothetical protein [Lysinibacillus antri]RUL56460.1 hypothetical protein EK386_02170 [Lysinibacillus antri]
MSIRDLFVEIGVDVDDDPLRDLDSLVDDVRESFNRLDASGLDDIERDVQSVADEFDDLSSEIRETNRLVNYLDDNDLDDLKRELAGASIQAEILEDGIEDVVEEEREAIVATSILGNMFALAGTKGIWMGVGITAAISGLIAIIAPLLVLVGGLGASFLAAGLGVVAFGAVAMGALGPVIEGAENLTAAQAKARTELENFTNFWGTFVKKFETPIFEAFGTGLSLAENILNGLEKTIMNVADVVNVLMTEMNNSVVGGGLKDFFDWMESNAAEAIYNFAHIFGNTLSGLWKMLDAFSPIAETIEQGLLSLTERFDVWAGNLASSNGFQQFMEYALTNGPKLMDTLGNLFGIIGDVIVALAPLGSLVLTGLQLLTGFIGSEVSPRLVELGGFIQQVAGTFLDYLIPTIAPLVQELLPVLSQWFDTLKNLGMTLFETFISILPTLQDIFQTVMPVVITLFENVYGIISSFINNIVIPLLPMLGTVIQEVWGVIKPILEPLKDLISTIGSTIMFLINEVVSPLIPVIGTVISAMWIVAKPILDGIVTVFGNIIDAVSSTIQAVKDLVSAFLNFKVPDWVSNLGGKISGVVGKLFDGSHATGLGRVPFDGYVAELHKDEAVLTADQSSALRDLGILKGDGNSPELDLSSNSSGGSYKTTSTTSSSISISNTFQISVEGGNTNEETASNLKGAMSDFMEEFFGNLLAIDPQVREG